VHVNRTPRLALVGDRHQLPAVGRGGAFDLDARWAPPEAHLTLDAVHRFADSEYAELSRLMRPVSAAVRASTPSSRV